MNERTDTLEADRLVLKMSKHLGNIAGFCDGWSQNRIHAMQRQFAISLTDSLGYIALKALLPFIVGIKVDFNKRPFRL